MASRRMMRAVLRGDAAEALRWRRVRQVLEAEEVEMDRLIVQDQRVGDYLRDLARAKANDLNDLNGLNGLNGVFGPR